MQGIKNIYFSDECTFSLNGDRHNNSYWSIIIFMKQLLQKSLNMSEEKKR